MNPRLEERDRAMNLGVLLRLPHAIAREPRETIARIWKFLDGAQTTGELYGRVLVVIAAEESASRVVPPVSHRRIAASGPRGRTRRKALRELAGPRPPASLTAPERASKRAHAAQAVEQLRSSEGWEQWLAARQLFTRTALPTSW
jgi:hypothetical protein